MRLTRFIGSLAVLVGAIAAAGCGCNYQVTTQQPITFTAAGGQGSFAVTARPGCQWDADEDHNAEDWVKVASGIITGNGSKTFNVLSDVQQPNVPLPRSGFINIYKQGTGSGVGTVVTKVEIQQK